MVVFYLHEVTAAAGPRLWKLPQNTEPDLMLIINEDFDG